jgi:hypothetical protein
VSASTSSTVWTAQATALRCPYCHASPGARCRTLDGRRTSAPHVGRLVPSFSCPLCGTVTTDPTNVASAYCTSCLDWTADAVARAAQDVLAW